MGEIELTCTGLHGDIKRLTASSALGLGEVFEASDATNTCIVYRVAPGGLLEHRWLTFDMLLDSDTTAVYRLQFFEPDDPRPFIVQFMLLIYAQARIRLPVSALDMNRWGLGREGAWLKALCAGRRVDPLRVDRIALAVIRTGGRRLRFHLTPPTLTDAEPAPLREPLLPKGALLDRFGQCAVRDWPSKTRGEPELLGNLKSQLRESRTWALPEGFSRWGGWTGQRLDATGFFRVQKQEQGWTMVDPDGYEWWSAGLDCVRSDIESVITGLEDALEEPPRGRPYEGLVKQRAGLTAVNYLGVNLKRAFGDAWRANWDEIAFAQLRRLGFNTVANWSEWDRAHEAQFPYVRPMVWDSRPTPCVYRDFPDVFDPAFQREAAQFAKQLKITKDDPALVGYFMMNEPTWGFSSECPAAGMLYTHERSHTRRRLVEFLKASYPAAAALAAGWGMDVSFAALESGIWKGRLTAAAIKDLEAFSTVMVEGLFSTLSTACRAVDPNHLNLGIRYAGGVPGWALAGMKAFDIFSVNSYTETVPDDLGEKICRVLDRPLLIGEWHFGALDAGLPSTGIGHVPTQADRGKAYRVYLEDAAAKPWCVGVHYFTMYDQSAIGRFDGENYNIGFFDVCNRAYDELAAAARQSHERMYRVRAGELKPYDDRPRYLPKVFS